MKTTIIAAATAAVALLSACGQAPTSAVPAPAPQVTVMAVHQTDVPIRSELPGRTAAFQVAQIRARVDGIVQQREFVEGSDVRAQQSLYHIDPAPYRASLASAQAVLQKNEATLAASNNLMERYQQLVSANAVSKQVYDNAVAARGQAAADVAAARAALETARINLGYTTVTAPIAGRISTSLVTRGAYVQASAATLLTTVEQLDPIYVDIQQFSGVPVDSATGSVNLRALFPNPQHVLLPGMFVRASVDQGVRPNAVLVPAGAVTRDRQGVASVLVVGKDQKVAQRPVQASILSGSSWVIDSGLAEGERVIVNGLQKVKPGTTVQAQEAPAAALANDAAPGVKNNG